MFNLIEVFGCRMQVKPVYQALGFVSLLFLVACKPAEQKAQNDTDQCIAPQKLVQKIYSQNLKLHSLKDAQVTEYFEPVMAARIKDEIECRKTQPVCNIDFDIFSDQQDLAKKLNPSLSFDDKTNTVRAEIKVDNENKVLSYEMGGEGCAKIKNIVYAGDYDLDMLLSNPTGEESETSFEDDLTHDSASPVVTTNN